MATRSQDLHNTGWGFASFITLLALALTLTAWFIHKETYRSPRDYMFRQRGNATPTGGEAPEHGAPAAEQGGGGAHGAAAQPAGH